MDDRPSARRLVVAVIAQLAHRHSFGRRVDAFREACRAGDDDHDPSDADLVSGAQRRFGDAAAVDARSVEALEIADPHVAVVAEDLGVGARHGGLVDLNVGVAAAAYDQRLSGPGDLELLPRLLIDDKFHVK